ncbi:glycosyltransferase [Synechococcus sp. PCC 6312]|uniref:glycosyltransferase n=1 Tax=Synechococcus sp. (strain ATCC 27167 / PCC 6312) TaxID=195253 RepID=UPI00029ED9B4|nr:glycosyltransferase [Synechococcus sp. PCC 6312]AFY62441.1 glycosyltransferase [Synechococcus sp. PCC 6312]
MVSLDSVSPPLMPGSRPLSAGVFVCLEWQPQAGGHVKCWERYAQAAANFPDLVDVTVYFLGQTEEVVTIAPNVRYHLLPPQFSTGQLKFLQQGAGDTDLWPSHTRLREFLPQHDVFQTTDTFSFAQAVRRYCQKTDRPLLTCLNTDLPLFTQVYSRDIIDRLLGAAGLRGYLGRLLLEQWQLDQRLGEDARKKLKRFCQACDRILVSRQADYDWLTSFLPPERVSWFRLGLDRELFHPSRRNSAQFRQRFQIPPDVPVLLFVGRVDASKKVMVMAEAARLLLDQGCDLHVFVAGAGGQMAEVKALLRDNVTLPGVLPQETLALVYASSDIFVFPSESETGPNVVVEARAAGLPVVISGFDNGARFIQQPGEDGLIVDSRDPQAWAAAILPLLTHPERRQHIGDKAHQITAATYLTWAETFEQDVLGAWSQVYSPKGRRIQI